jgi:uncharacterized coiled-coil protein SlyX
MIVLDTGDGTRSRPIASATRLVDLMEPSGEVDKGLVSCLRRVSYRKALFLFFISVSPLISIIPHVLVLSENLEVKRWEEASQAKKIAELNEAYANLKIEKESVGAGYRRLSDKYKKLEAKTKALKREKGEAEKLCVAQVAEVEKKLVKETNEYTKYSLEYRCSLLASHQTKM